MDSKCCANGTRPVKCTFVLAEAALRSGEANIAKHTGEVLQADDATELRELLATMRATLGPEHPETLVTAALLARVLFFADREEALELEEQAQRTLRESRAKAWSMVLNSHHPCILAKRQQ